MKRSSHVKQEEDLFTPLILGISTARYLNGWLLKKANHPTDREKASIDAVAGLVRRSQKLETLAACGEGRGKAEFAKALNWISRLFVERYHGAPSLLAEMNSLPMDWRIGVSLKVYSDEVEVECYFAHNVFALLFSGWVSRLKKCEQCNNWLFARFKHQRFCSEDCRERFHQSNEADKKRRADWARDKRKREKRSRLHKQSLWTTTL